MRRAFDTLPDEPLVVAEEASGFRDEPTVPAETRTVKLAELAPWYDEPPRPAKKRDAMLVPALVFVGVLALVIGYVLATQPARRAAPATVQVF